MCNNKENEQEVLFCGMKREAHFPMNMNDSKYGIGMQMHQ
jgi:hypothetical protein